MFKDTFSHNYGFGKTDGIKGLKCFEKCKNFESLQNNKK